MKPIVKIALALLLLNGNAVPAFSLTNTTCRGLLVEEGGDYKLIPASYYSNGRFCDAYIFNDAKKLVDLVLTKCELKRFCFIKGSVEGHGVFHWTNIISVHSVEAQCYKVNLDDPDPTVVLSGLVTKHHKKLPKKSEQYTAKGYYLKLDKPLLRRYLDSDKCDTYPEITITFGVDSDTDERILKNWNKAHVVVEGVLSSAVSGLAYPGISIKVLSVYSMKP